jgi:hypothetical protein
MNEVNERLSPQTNRRSMSWCLPCAGFLHSAFSKLQARRVMRWQSAGVTPGRFEQLEDRRLLTTIDLGSLGNGGISILGADAEDASGDAVSVGDFNGDGFDDVLILAPKADAANNLKVDAGDVNK